MSAGPASVLLVDDDAEVLVVLKRVVEEMGLTARAAASLAEARAALREGNFDVVVSDVHLGTADAGVRLAQEARALRPDLPVVLITGNPELETALSALRTHAFDYLAKPFALGDLRRVLRRALAARVDAEPFREELREELSAAYSELKKVERTREGMLSIMSHELRTPLCLAKVASEQIAVEACSPDGAAARRLLTQGLDRLEREIGDILLHARLAGGVKTERTTAVDLAELAAEAADDLADEASSLGVRIELSSGARQAAARGDRDLLARAVRHLMSNAVRFNRRGGRVLVRLGGDPERHEISVCDEGGGIPPGELEKVFDPYYQVADFMTRRTGGLGLGLSIVREVFQGHGGEVLALNRPGAGCEFRAWIPAGAPAV